MSVDYTLQSLAVHIPAWESERQGQHILEVVDTPSVGLYSRAVCSAAPVGNLFSHFLYLESLQFLGCFHGQSLSPFLVVGCCMILHSLQLPSLAVEEAEDHRSSSAMSFLRLRPQGHDLLARCKI